MGSGKCPQTGQVQHALTRRNWFSWFLFVCGKPKDYTKQNQGNLSKLNANLFQGYQTGAFYLNYEPDYSKIPIKVLTHEEAKRNMEKAAKEEPAPEPEDVAPATFEAEPEATSNIAAADIEVAENEQPTEGDDLPPAVSDIVEQTTVVDDLPTAVSEVVKSEADQEIVEPEQKSES